MSNGIYDEDEIEIGELIINPKIENNQLIFYNYINTNPHHIIEFIYKYNSNLKKLELYKAFKYDDRYKYHNGKHKINNIKKNNKSFCS